MEIILISGDMGKGRVITLSHAQLMMLGVGLVILMVVLGAALFKFTMRYATDVKNPYLRSLVSTLYQQELDRSELQLQDNVAALATRLGEMQARLMRLDAVGARLARAAGINLPDFDFSSAPGRGGAAPNPATARDLTVGELAQEVAQTSRWLNDRADHLTLIDDALLQQRLNKQTLPTVLPVTSGYFSSNYGSRIDPFSGRSTLHEGIDFVAPTGTRVQAAAGGTVLASEWFADYGNIVEIDHGDGLTSRYAHLSRRKVKVGDVVLKGQPIGDLGSTGRSTGPHLHFEVRRNGVAVNPKQFLELDG